MDSSIVCSNKMKPERHSISRHEHWSFIYYSNHCTSDLLPVSTFNILDTSKQWTPNNVTKQKFVLQQVLIQRTPAHVSSVHWNSDTSRIKSLPDMQVQRKHMGPACNFWTGKDICKGPLEQCSWRLQQTFATMFIVRLPRYYCRRCLPWTR